MAANKEDQTQELIALPQKLTPEQVAKLVRMAQGMSLEIAQNQWPAADTLPPGISLDELLKLKGLLIPEEEAEWWALIEREFRQTPVVP